MANDRLANVKFTSPKGVLTGFTHLTSYDEYENSKKYKANLTVDEDIAAPLMAEIDKLVKEQFDKTIAEMKAKGGKHIVKAKKQTKYVPYEPEYDEAGEETGRVTFKASANAFYKSRDRLVPTRISYIDAKTKPITEIPLIYSGSTVRIAGVLVPFHNPGTDQAGVSIRIYTVQLIELKTGGGGAGAGDFDVEEEGYADGDAPGFGGGFEDESEEAEDQAPEEVDEDTDF